MVREKLPFPSSCATQGHVPEFLLVIFNQCSNINNRQLGESLELKDKLSGTGPISFMDSLVRLNILAVCLADTFKDGMEAWVFLQSYKHCF
jgi:hypothetical protein